MARGFCRSRRRSGRRALGIWCCSPSGRPSGAADLRLWGLPERDHQVNCMTRLALPTLAGMLAELVANWSAVRPGPHRGPDDARRSLSRCSEADDPCSRSMPTLDRATVRAGPNPASLRDQGLIIGSGFYDYNLSEVIGEHHRTGPEWAGKSTGGPRRRSNPATSTRSSTSSTRRRWRGWPIPGSSISRRCSSRWRHRRRRRQRPQCRRGFLVRNGRALLPLQLSRAPPLRNPRQRGTLHHRGDRMSCPSRMPRP